MHNKKLFSNIILLITAVIWGSAFVAQRIGMDSIGPFTFNAVRFLMSSIFVLLLTLALSKKNPEPKVEPASRKTLFQAILICGFCIFGGTTLQQYGLVFTTAGKAAFITTLYILLIPILGIFLGRKNSPLTWLAIGIGAVGLFLLCIKQDFTIDKGDFIVLIGAFFWSFHVLTIDHFLQKGVNPFLLSLGQMLVVFVLSTVAAFLFETPELSGIKNAIVALLYTGILSGGVGYTFQIIGQRHADPVVASLIMSTEAAFGTIAGFLFLHEMMTGREITGSVLLFAAVLLSQLKVGDKS